MTARQPVNGHRPGLPPPAGDWDGEGSRPGPDTPLLRCRCGAAYHGSAPGRAAHKTVFGHPPRPGESRELKGDAIRPPGETPG